MARVLIVEDYRPLASAIRMAISHEGHAGIQCHSVREALQQDYCECAVLDLELPDGNGVDLAEQLLSEYRVGSVVFFTACHDGQLLARAAGLGVVVPKSGGCSRLMVELGRWTELEARQQAAVVGLPGGTATGPRTRSGLQRRVKL